MSRVQGNRLIQVNLPGTAVLDDYGIVTSGALGDWIATYRYDGVGRLITIDRVQSGQAVTIDLYYDGVRRIQERVVYGDQLGQQMMAGGGGSDAPSDGGDFGADVSPTSLLTPGPEDFGALTGGDFTPIDTPPPIAPEEQFDPEAEDAAIRLDASMLAVSSEPPSPEGGGQQSSMMSGSSSAPIAEREYVWGPDYVDECVAQFDQNNVVYYVIQDANYDVVALLKSDGKPSIQYTYEPYGPLQLAESFAQQPVNRLGHQGLFFERFDAGPYDPALVPGAKGVYNANNRWYDPLTGRWLTRDPNETALPVQTALATNGTMLDVMLPGVNLQGTYADGMNLYAYVGTSPVNLHDPLGLSFDWFGASADFESDWYGNKMYAIGAINEGAKWAAIGLQSAIGIAKFFIPGSGLIDAFNAVEVLRSGKGGFWEALDIASAAFPIVHGAAKLAGLSSIFKARGWLSKAAHACNSFVAGTQVDTPEGPVPIECIIPGVRVVTRDQRDPGQQECAGVVTGVSKRVAPMVLWVTLATGQTVGMTPGHEV
ncbi:MAG TPA: hypothetical protein VGM03_05140, partial [Phycisphaerae bacterium]